MSEYMKTGVYNRGEDEFMFEFNTSLSVKEKVSFVSSVVDIVVDDNYYDFLVDLIFDYEIIDRFTNVDLSEIEYADNQIDAIERLLAETNIVEIVKANDYMGTIDELRNSVMLGIEYRTGIHRNLVDEALSGLIRTFENTVSKIDVSEMSKMAQMLSGISGELTPAKILDAYAETDMYKGNRKQIKEDDNPVDNESVKVVKGGKKSSSKKSKNSPSSTLQSPDYEA